MRKSYDADSKYAVEYTIIIVRSLHSPMQGTSSIATIITVLMAFSSLHFCRGKAYTGSNTSGSGSSSMPRASIIASTSSVNGASEVDDLHSGQYCGSVSIPS